MCGVSLKFGVFWWFFCAFPLVYNNEKLGSEGDRCLRGHFLQSHSEPVFCYCTPEGLRYKLSVTTKQLHNKVAHHPMKDLIVKLFFLVDRRESTSKRLQRRLSPLEPSFRYTRHSNVEFNLICLSSKYSRLIGQNIKTPWITKKNYERKKRWTTKVYVRGSTKKPIIFCLGLTLTKSIVLPYTTLYLLLTTTTTF